MSLNERLIRFIDPITSSALIGAGASVAGGVINGVGSIFTRKKDRKFAHDEAVLARQHAENMYNQYSSPVAQRQQMLEAGLNPMGAISPQSVGTSSSQASTPSGSSPDFGSALTGGFAGFVQGKQLAMQIKSQKLANDIAEEDLKTKQLDNQMKAIDANNYPEYKRITMEMLKDDSEFKKLSRQEQELKIKQMYEAAGNGWNPFSNEDRAADDAHRAADDAHRAADDAHDLSAVEKDHRKLFYDLDAKYSDIERQLEYDYKQMQGDVLSRNYNISEPAAYDSLVESKAYVHTGISPSAIDPVLLPYYRYLGAKLVSGDWSPDSEKFKSFSKALVNLQRLLTEYDINNRNPDYLTKKDYIEINRGLLNDIRDDFETLNSFFSK